MPLLFLEQVAAMGSGGAAAWVETPLALVLAILASVSDLCGLGQERVASGVGAAAEYLSSTRARRPRSGFRFISAAARVSSRVKNQQTIFPTVYRSTRETLACCPPVCFSAD